MPPTSLDLPLFPKDMQLDIALQRLHAVHRAAAVYILGEQFYMVNAAAMASTRAKRLKETGEAGVMTDIANRQIVQVDEEGHVRIGGEHGSGHTVAVGGKKVRIVVPLGAGASHFESFINEPGHGSSIWKGLAGASAKEDFLQVFPGVGAMAGSPRRPDHPRVDVKLANPAMAAVLGVAPRDYYCDGPAEHDYFPPPNVNVGDPCPSGDKARVVSSR